MYWGKNSLCQTIFPAIHVVMYWGKNSLCQTIFPAIHVVMYWGKNSLCQTIFPAIHVVMYWGKNSLCQTIFPAIHVVMYWGKNSLCQTIFPAIHVVMYWGKNSLCQTIFPAIYGVLLWKSKIVNITWWILAYEPMTKCHTKKWDNALKISTQKLNQFSEFNERTNDYFPKITWKRYLRPNLLSEHDVFPAALQKISCNKRSFVMIGHENNKSIVFWHFFFFTRSKHKKVQMNTHSF